MRAAEEMPTIPASVTPDFDAHLSAGRRACLHVKEADGAQHAGARRSLRSATYLHGGAPALSGLSVSELVQDGSLSGYSSSLCAYARADDARPADGAPVPPPLSILQRARADSRSSAEMAAALERARRLPRGPPPSISPSLSLSALLGEEHNPSAHEEGLPPGGADQAEPVRTRAQRSPSRQPSATRGAAHPPRMPRLSSIRAQPPTPLSLARQRALAAAAPPAGLALRAQRRPSAEAMLRANPAARSEPMSVAALLDPQLVDAHTLREERAAADEPDGGAKDKDQASAAAGNSAAPHESSIQRALRVNWEASIARGDAPKRRPSRDLSYLALASAAPTAPRVTASSLLGH